MYLAATVQAIETERLLRHFQRNFTPFSYINRIVELTNHVLRHKKIEIKYISLILTAHTLYFYKYNISDGSILRQAFFAVVMKKDMSQLVPQVRTRRRLSIAEAPISRVLDSDTVRIENRFRDFTLSY